MTSTKVHVMCHGEMDSPKGILYGRLPGYGLMPLDREMAQRDAGFLRNQGVGIIAVISPPLLRAQLTATPTVSAYDLSIISDPRLIEANNNFEGLLVNTDHSLLLRPSVWKNYLRSLGPSWGEPYVDITKHMRMTASGALKAAKGHKTLIISHQSPITTLTHFARKQPLARAPQSRQCSLASITNSEFEDVTPIGIPYVEPSADLLKHTQDTTPGDSVAALRR